MHTSILELVHVNIVQIVDHIRSCSVDKKLFDRKAFWHT
jgi:hypothetical protein